MCPSVVTVFAGGMSSLIVNHSRFVSNPVFDAIYLASHPTGQPLSPLTNCSSCQSIFELNLKHQVPIKHWDLPTNSSVLEFDMTSFPRARGHPMTEDEFTLRFIPIFRQLVTTATALLIPFRHTGTSH